MSRVVLNVATDRYVVGQQRLAIAVAQHSPGTALMTWANKMPPSSPTHKHMPYAFKAWAVEAAREAGHTRILWADASILPIRSMEPLWQRIERDGYWFSRNGWKNSEWTARETLPLLGVTDEQNQQIEHVVATAFGLDLRSEIGQEFAEQYLRLAQNGAFRGPWTGGIGIQHRHDQTAASVIAWRLGMKLTDPPAWFAYRGGETEDTVLCADGAY